MCEHDKDLPQYCKEWGNRHIRIKGYFETAVQVCMNTGQYRLVTLENCFGGIKVKAGPWFLATRER